MNLLWKLLRRYRRTLVGAMALGAINQFFSLLDPQIFRLIIDNYASRASTLARHEFLSGVGLLLLASVGVALVSRIAKNFQDYYVNSVTQRVGAQLYGHGVAHSLSLPFAAFEDRRSGELLQQLQKARTDVQLAITSAINTVFLSLIGIVFVLSYAFTVHWAAGTAYTLLIPVLGASTFFISRRIKQAQAAIVAQTAELAGSTTETLRNVELVKSLGLEAQETGRLNDVNDRILQLELGKVKLVRKLSFIQGTIINAARSGILLLMMYLIFSQYISLGQFFSLFIYSFFIFNPLGELMNFATQYQEARASLALLQTVLDTPAEVHPASPRDVGALESIELRNVSFSYASGSGDSVMDVSATLSSGQTVAFVGPSGAGKSTLLKLLVGLYKPTSGQVLVNGVAGEQIDYRHFRGRIGYVAQETQLFAGTIRENLLFVRPDATDGDCLAALAGAAAMPIVERGGQGLDTKIGESGIKVSGGERQRLAIARALLRNPELLILDEATSSLDSLTERAITHTVQEIAASRPHLLTVLVAHRLSTVAHADAIFVLEKGKLIERGTHAELLAAGGLYAALWREQQASA